MFGADLTRVVDACINIGTPSDYVVSVQLVSVLQSFFVSQVWFIEVMVFSSVQTTAASIVSVSQRIS